MSDKTHRYITGIFTDQGDFDTSVRRLLDGGFEPSAISLLATREALRAKYGDDIPPIERLADAPDDAPHISLAANSGERGIIHMLAEVVATVAHAGAAGAALLVGGPYGPAALLADRVEETVENVLEQFVGEEHINAFEATLKGDGLVVWVAAHSAEEEKHAQRLLEEGGARNVHLVT